MDVQIRRKSTINRSVKIRPIAITVICIISFAGAVISLGLILAKLQTFLPVFQKIGSWYLPYLIVSAIIGLFCFIGLWYMRKWSVYVYTIFCIVNQVLLIETHTWTLFSLLMSLIFVGIMWVYIKKMK